MIDASLVIVIQVVAVVVYSVSNSNKHGAVVASSDRYSNSYSVNNRLQVMDAVTVVVVNDNNNKQMQW